MMKKGSEVSNAVLVVPKVQEGLFSRRKKLKRSAMIELTSSGPEESRYLEPKRGVKGLLPFDESVLATMASGWEKAGAKAVDVERICLHNSEKAPLLSSSGLFVKYHVDSPILSCALAPKGHCAELFLKEDEVFFSHNMKWIWSTIAVMTEMRIPSEGLEIF